MKKYAILTVALLIICIGIATVYIKNQNVVPKSVDVVVVGGEPEGVAAALSAARNGAKVLLIEHREELGGLFTYGMLNFLDIPQGPDGQSVSKGIFEEWHKLVGGKSSFDVELAKKVFRELVENEKNITLITETEVTSVKKDDNQLSAINIKYANNQYEVKAKTFIDATQDADFAVMAGAPYFVGGEDVGIEDKKMSVTLMIHLKNVDWEGVRNAADSGVFGESYVTDSAAWGFGNILKMYKPVEENTRLRGLNIAKVDDQYYINALQIFGVDGLDPVSKKEGIERGKRELKHIVEFLRKEVSGFENAEIASIPPELYVRETRHIKAEYQLSMADVWTNRDQVDKIAYGSYPVDIQAQTPKDYGNVVSSPEGYAIPFRSLVPQKIDGLLVVGRAAGFSSIAAGSARVVPTGMATGEAAGVAAAQVAKSNQTFRELMNDIEGIQKIQQTLKKQGAFLGPLNTTYPYAGEWFDEAVQQLLNYGLIFGRYDNDLQVEKEATVSTYVNLISETLYRTNRPYYDENIEKIIAMKKQASEKGDVLLSSEEAMHILAELLNKSEEELLSDEEFIAVWSKIDSDVKMKHVYGFAYYVMEHNIID